MSNNLVWEVGEGKLEVTGENGSNERKRLQKHNLSITIQLVNLLPQGNTRTRIHPLYSIDEHLKYCVRGVDRVHTEKFAWNLPWFFPQG